MCGGGSPPAPPDYTPQRNEEVSLENANRQAHAKSYNELVSKFNSDVDNFSKMVSSSIGAYNKKGIADLAGDRSEFDSLDNLKQQLSGLRFETERPNWSPTITSFGQSVSAAMPSLNTANVSGVANIQRMLDAAESKLSSAYNSRETEQNRINNYANDFQTEIDTTRAMLDGLDFADLSSLNAARGSLIGLTGKSRGYSSVLDPNGLSEFNPEMDALKQKLDGLFAQRKAEEDRVKNYRSSLISDADNYTRQLRGMTIADLDKINQLNDALDARMLDASRFETPLTADFSSVLSGMYNTDRGIDQLLQKRQDELDRIKNTQDRASLNAEDYLAAANNLDVYSRSALDDLMRRTTLGEREIQGFSSLLPFDFSSSQSAYDSAQERVQQLLAERETNLNAIKTAGSLLDDNLGDVPLYQEDTFNDRLSQLQEQLSQLAMYTGQGVQPINTELSSVRNALQAKLRELGTYRNTMETDLQNYIADLQANGLYSESDVQKIMASDGKLPEFRKNLDLYRATQAEDEYRTLQSFLNAQLARLQEESRQKAALSERERLALQNGYTAGMTYNGIPLTEAEYLALIKKKQDEQNSMPTTNAFTAGLIG